MMALKLRAADFLQAFLKLLPRGRVWSRDLGTVQNRALLGLNSIYEQNTVRAHQLLSDVFPGSTVELLPEWESTFGLPDPCAGPIQSQSRRLRRAQVMARLKAVGGQSIAYLTMLAETLDYAVTITQSTPSRFGKRFGTPFGGNDWAHVWNVHVPKITVHSLSFGDSFGVPFASWGDKVLQCELQSVAPAHTLLIFSYKDDDHGSSDSARHR